jgi:hypothetical protein
MMTKTKSKRWAEYKLDQPFPEEYLNQLKEYPEGLPEKPPVNLDFEEITAVAALNTFKTDLPKTDLHDTNIDEINWSHAIASEYPNLPIPPGYWRPGMTPS